MSTKIKIHSAAESVSPVVEQMRRWFALPEQPRGIGRTLGIKGISVSDGLVTLQGNPTADHYNPLGTVHGGYAATMLDGALALAVSTMLPPGMGYATSNLNVSYLRTLTDASGPLKAEGKLVHQTQRTAMAEAKLFDRDGKLSAHATGTFVIYPLKAS